MKEELRSFRSLQDDNENRGQLFVFSSFCIPPYYLTLRALAAR